MGKKETRFPFYNDDVFKFLISLKTRASYVFVCTLIYLITSILPLKIERLDRVLERQNKNFKQSEVDGLFIVNDQFILDIEVQRQIDIKALNNKIQRYLGYMLTSAVSKGESDDEDIYKVMMIIFYSGSIDKNKDLVVTGEYKAENNSTGLENNMKTFVVQLNKTTKIFKEKGIKMMNLLEKICFVIQNAHEEKYHDIIKVLEKQEKEVAYMERSYDIFKMDQAAYLAAKLKEVNEEAIRQTIRNAKRNAEIIGMQQGLQKGMQKGLQKGLQQGLQKGKQEIVFNMLASQKYTIEDIAEITHLDIEEIKQYRDMVLTK